MRTLTMAFLMLLALPPGARANDTARDAAGTFDYYVLAISWVPAWCAREGDDRNAPTCAPGAGVGWGVHGLWPQHDDGTWPEFCPTPHRNPSRAQTAAESDLFGSGGSAWHQWNKHGRCTGLSAGDYYALTRHARDRFDLPALDDQPRMATASLHGAIRAANPDLAADSFVLTCRQGALDELRLCLTRDLTPRPCDARLAARACDRRSLRLPPPR
ncbi:MAG: ribonuclease T [Rhodobacteraceae bacterium]|nr:ribonuclease T [Paracoccaceae bacterium]